MNLPKNKTLRKNTRSTKKTRLSLRPLSTNIRMLMAGSIVLGSLSLASHSHAAMALPKPAGAWATARSPLPRVSSASGWQQLNENLWRSGSTEAQFSDKTLTIKQTDGKVILSWDSFDIDVSHLVQFKQPDSSSIALNRILNSASPSKILGTLKANGQIYLINNNGFLFGANSVVDVNSLVVSTLDISDDVFNRGITQVFKTDASAAFTGNGEVYLRDPGTGEFILNENGERYKIGIYIDKGAEINAESSGRIIMVAPEIDNHGTITSPKGQVILAAATDKVYLQKTDLGDAVKGLLVEVGTGGEVSNYGNIVTERGNATLMGFAVNQMGLISATTSVTVNGSIRLLARENATITPDGKVVQATSTSRSTAQDDGLGTVAKVTFGSNSVTRIMPEPVDPDKPEMAAAEQIQPKSYIEVMAQTVHLKSGSAIIAQSGIVDIVATKNPTLVVKEVIDKIRYGDNNRRSKVNLTKYNNDSRILIEEGSLIDVSGIDDVKKTMESNVINVQLQTKELADSPAQKFGFLNGKDIYIDIREGTPLANIQPALDKIESTVAERHVEGGIVNLASEGDVIVEQGASIDVSGGAITFDDGYINTTKLLTNTGDILDISVADPDLNYVDILGTVSKTYEKWGITRTWEVNFPSGKGRFEPGYVQGQAAGVAYIGTQRLLLEGDVIGNTVNGRLQQRVNDRARGGTLDIDLGLSGQNVAVLNNKAYHNINLEDIFPRDELNDDKAAPLLIDPAYFKRNNLQTVTIKTGGSFDIANDVKIDLPDASSYKIEAGEIYVGGKVFAYGSDLDFAASIKAEIGENAILDVSGRWTNDNPVLKPVLDFDMLTLDAGSIKVTSERNLILQKGALFKANSGAWSQTDGTLITGKSGTMRFDAKGAGSGNPKSSLLNYGARFEAYSFADSDSGSLTLGSNEVYIVSEAPALPDGLDESVITPLYIDDDFVTGRGFKQYNFVSHKNGITIKNGADIRPNKKNLVLTADALLAEDGTPIETITQKQYLPDDIRQSVSLDFTHNVSGNTQNNGVVTMESGAMIHTDPLAVVSFSSDTNIFMNGMVVASAGEINLKINRKLAENKDFFVDSQAIWLSEDSLLSVAGTMIENSTRIPNLDRGTVLDAGSVSLKADRGYVVISEGARIDVSGATATLDIADPGSRGLGASFTSTQVASDAGSVNITAAEGLLSDGQFIANSNRALGAKGGSLEISYPKIRPGVGSSFDAHYPTGARIINVSQDSSTKAIPEGLKAGESIPDSYNGQTTIDLDEIANSGFDSLTLTTPDEIRFQGDNNLSFDRRVILNTPLISWQRNDNSNVARVNITTAYAKIGSDKTTADYSQPGTGEAQFDVNANLIDLEGINNLQGFNSATLNSQTDIRLLGVINLNDKAYRGNWKSAGTLTLDAQQIYPTSLSDFSINADTISIKNSQPYSANARLRVLSAAGKMSFQADTIIQSGTLLAPFGEIELMANTQLDLLPGSLTSTSASGLVVPFGITEQSGRAWIYPIDDKVNKVYEADEGLGDKRILLSADKINFSADAVLDISAGGDLQAYEFIAGRGGSEDIFAGKNVFAVMPGIDSYAPLDHMETLVSSRETGLQVGDSVYLSAANGLPEGNYALLPAHYALLDGGYLIRPEAGFTGMRSSSRSYLTDGTPVTAGYRYVQGTNVRDSVWSGFSIESGQQARRHSELIITTANQFYTELAINEEIARPLLPMDAGQVSFLAGSSLNLDGDLRADVLPGGRGSWVDIQANQLAVVNSVTGTEGVVELRADNLNRLSVESLLLGGMRQRKKDGTYISVGANQISIGAANEKDPVLLELPEILLAASERVTIKSGASVRTREKSGLDSSTRIETLVVDGDGALLQVSEGKQVRINRLNSSGLAGEIIIEEGASLVAGRKDQNGNTLASGAMLLDVGKSITRDGKLEIASGSLNIGTNKISLGEVPDTITDLILDELQIEDLDLEELVLTSRKGIDIYGDARFDLDRVVFDGPGVNGYGDVNSVHTLNANTVRFTGFKNSSNNTDPVATGTGEFTVAARDIELGSGDYKFTGYSKVNLNAREQIQGDGKSNITVNADLVMSAQRITAKSGADTRINAAGHRITTAALASTGLAAVTGLGGRLDLSADSIVHGGRIELPAGIVNLTATNGVVILDNSSLIDVSGVAIDFDGVFATADAGRVSLVSESNNVRIVNGARIDLSGSTEGGDAGKLTVSASEGEFEWNGNIIATASEGYAGGSFDLDVDTMSNGLPTLNTQLLDAGFTEQIKIRQRTGDIVVASDMSVRAHEVFLSADTGNIQVQGLINASGSASDADGGEVILSAGDNVEVTGRIDASASDADAKGGYVEFATIDSDNDGIGLIDVQGEINVSGGTDGEGGEVWYRAKRVDSFDGNSDDGVIDDVAIVSVGTITGAESISVEAVRIYDNVSRIGETEKSQWQADTNQYMNAALEKIQTRLGSNSQLLPGLEIRNNGDITIDAELDFAATESRTDRSDLRSILYDWRYGANNDIPGIFTLRAGGNLLVNHSISDGFVSGDMDIGGFSIGLDDILIERKSWSYRFIGGADLTSANVMDVVAKEGGNVELKENVKIRTGTGKIEIAAGNDFTLEKDTSVVYTAGRAAASNASNAAERRYERWGSISEILDSFYVEYPLEGGDVSIYAGGNIKGAVNNTNSDNQFFTDWLYSTGDWRRGDDHSNDVPTTWGIRFGHVYRGVREDNVDPAFKQNIGALGGGDIKVSAAGNINDLSVIIPTTGKQLSGKAYYPDYNFGGNIVEVAGGGNLDINAGGDIYGGVYYLAKGQGNIQAGGGLLTSTVNNAGPVLALGDSQFNLRANGDINLSGAVDPFVLKSPQSDSGSRGSLQRNGDVPNNYFYNYSQDSALSLTSLSGDIIISNKLIAAYDIIDGTSAPGLIMYPATLYASALYGDINFQTEIKLYPSTTGNLNLLAANNITKDAEYNAVTISMTADVDLTLIPTLQSPEIDGDRLNSSFWGQPLTPNHQGDEQPVRIIAKTGNITSEGSNMSFVTQKKTRVIAGRDIKDVNVSIQNIESSDDSFISAGRDLKYSFSRIPGTGKIQTGGGPISISGPGTLEVMAGRNLNLAASSGIQSIGNTKNPVLAEDGADLIIMAGVDVLPDYDAFAFKYIENSEDYATALVSYVESGTVEFDLVQPVNAADITTARTKFKALSSDKQEQLLRRIFFNELQESGSVAAAGDLSAYGRGYAAIDSLLPGYADADSGHKGDINLYYSTITTADGGNIELFAPAGEVNAGLSSSGGSVKGTNELGIIAVRAGNISAYALNDFMVNQSRVFTVGAGDVLIWSNQGDIDAGRGAKTALAAPPPITVFDEKGNMTIEFPPAVQGSGIRAFEVGELKGNVALFAPRGVVDAGEAGIGGNNVTIGAPTILGADNIDIGGTSVGVPTAPVSIAAGLSGVSNVSASSSKVAEESTSSIGQNSEAGFADTPMGFLNIELLGFGGGVTSTTAPTINTDSKIKF